MADDTAWQAFSERVCIDAPLRVAVTAEARADDRAGLAERNLAALQNLAALEERRTDGGGSDDDSPVLQELARLDAKLNALVDIVNRLLLPADALPPRQPVRVNAVGVVLPAALLPVATGDAAAACLVTLHFDACPSLPLVLPAQVRRRFDDGRAFVVFEPPGDALQDALERLVFRHHRRRIAESRHSLT